MQLPTQSVPVLRNLRSAPHWIAPTAMTSGVVMSVNVRCFNSMPDCNANRDYVDNLDKTQCCANARPGNEKYYQTWKTPLVGKNHWSACKTCDGNTKPRPGQSSILNPGQKANNVFNALQGVGGVSY